MAESGLILVTGAGGGVGGVGGKFVSLLRQRGRAVRAMAHHDDDRADPLRALGADVVVGDLTRPTDVAAALDSVQRMFFSMSLAPSYGPYVDEHLETMARLHRENRYDRMTATVEEITGQPAESVQAFVARRGDLFAD